MNIEEWKKFSDFIDTYEKTLDHRLSQKDFPYWKFQQIMTMLRNDFSKTVEHFYEWKCGKLTMDNIDIIVDWASDKKNKNLCWCSPTKSAREKTQG